MPDLSLPLPEAPCQLPASDYFNESQLASEQLNLFASGPRYVAHALSAPQLGDYHALAHEGFSRALAHTPNGIELISNVCRHRQAVILRGRGNLGPAPSNIVCPLHRWTYSAGHDGQPAGRLIASPRFDSDPCLHLSNTPLREWNGMLFEASGRDIAGDLARLDPRIDLNFSGLALDRIEVRTCDYNWKTFIELYQLNRQHGLSNLATENDPRWDFGEHCSAQSVGVANPIGRAGHERSAIKLICYPNLMVEWHPQALIVATLHPTHAQKTIHVVEFYYPEEISAFEREFAQAHQAAYMQACAENDAIALSMDAWRVAQMPSGETKPWPHQTPMEAGAQHFHEWHRRHMPQPDSA